VDIAVVIPAFDRAAVLPRALDSVLAQSMPADEVIVVDDGSRDGTAGLVRDRYPRVRLIRQDHHGVSRARNTGIRASSAEWIALLDSDDEWHPDKLERQAAALTEKPRYRVCHSDETWIRDGRRVNQMRKHARAGGRIFDRCLPQCAISPSTALIHRSVFAAAGLFDESLPVCEDYDLWLRVCARYPVLYVGEPLVTRYGGHADQLSRRYPAMDRFRIQALEGIVRSGLLDDRDRDAAMRTALEKIDIFVGGARRRGRDREASLYEERRRALLVLGKGARKA